MKPINICGVLLHVMPAHIANVRRQIELDPGVEVHAETDDGRLVVTVEKDQQADTGDTLNRFQTMEHVVCASVVYQYFDDDT
jgi:periplasmic nitrate reductase NapD